MAGLQVNSAAFRQARAAARAKEEAMSSPTQDLQQMMKEARERARAAQDQYKKMGKGNARYGDAPLEAYARLAKAKNAAQVNAAAGFARRQIARLKAAKQTDPDNAKRIQAAINQLQKAVHRAGKKNRELEREKVSEARQKKLAQEKRAKEAQRQRQELRRKQAARALRESAYIREAEIDNRMQSQIAAVDMELREQAQSLTASIQPSPEAVAQQYAAGSAAAEAAGGEIDLQA